MRAVILRTYVIFIVGLIFGVYAVAVVGYFGVLAAYEAVLRWSFDSGNWWWVFPLGIGATIGLCHLVESKEERERSKREMREEMRERWERWKRTLTLGRWRTR